MNLSKVSKRRAISQIMGTMFMLALVVPVGTVIVTKGMNEVGVISNRLTSGITYENEGGQEDIVFEHVHFEPTGNKVSVSIRNVGTVDSTIVKVVMIKTDSQELLINEKNLTLNVQPHIGQSFSEDASLQFTSRWDDQNYVNSDYKISVMTEKGNFFEIVARPFNT